MHRSPARVSPNRPLAATTAGDASHRRGTAFGPGRRRTTPRGLAALSDRVLADIGLSRADVGRDTDPAEARLFILARALGRRPLGS